MTKHQPDRHQVCVRCGENKPITEFSIDSTKANNGRKRRCKVCLAAIGRQYYEKNSERIKQRNIAYEKIHWTRLKELRRLRNDPLKFKAYWGLHKALNKGDIQKVPCQECGEPKSEFHHTNGYDKPNWLVGKWLCRKHHAQAHKELRWQTS